MYSYEYPSFLTETAHNSFPTAADSDLDEPDPYNVWLFTDAAAKAAYLREGKLRQLEQDIRTYAMFAGRWNADELDFKRQVNRLVRDGILAAQPAFGHLSPHPTIYKASNAGVIRIGGENFHFEAGDEVVFEPWSARLVHPGVVGPLRVGRLTKVGYTYLCSDEFSQLRGLCDTDLNVLHQISCYQTHSSL